MKVHKRQSRCLEEVSHFFLSKYPPVDNGEKTPEIKRKFSSPSLSQSKSTSTCDHNSLTSYLSTGADEKEEIAGRPKKAPVGFVIVDRDRIMRFANFMAREMLGIKDQDIFGKIFNFLIEVNKVSEISIIRRDGKSGIGAMQMGEIMWEGELVYFAVLRDITKSWRQGKMLSGGGGRGIISF